MYAGIKIMRALRAITIIHTYPEISAGALATFDSQVLQAMSAISSWAECSKANDRAIDRLTTPLK
jgi:hypothetical protein